jgi:CBS domain containing-hemolysin-like protein
MDTSAPDTDSPFKRILNFFGINRAPDTTEDIEQEIQELLDDGEEQGLITREEGEMISSILEFSDTLVREIMTPEATWSVPRPKYRRPNSSS